MNRLRRFITAAVYGMIVAAHAHALEPASHAIAAQGTLQAAFSPWDDVESLITGAIDNARQQVLVHAYLLTSKKIAKTLIAAHRRGVDVRVLTDAQQVAESKASKIPELVAAGIPVWLETKYQNAHNKIIVIDANTATPVVITGSYNFTWTAQRKNAENILIARGNPALTSRFSLNWSRHQHDAVPFKK